MDTSEQTTEDTLMRYLLLALLALSTVACGDTLTAPSTMPAGSRLVHTPAGPIWVAPAVCVDVASCRAVSGLPTDR